MCIGIIGAGNMAAAIIKGLTKDKDKTIYIHDVDRDALNRISQTPQIIALDSNEAVVKRADIIILAVKPQVYPKVLDEIKGYITDSQVLISIAAGISIDFIREVIGTERNVDIVRIMPNTPALIGEGVIAICKNEDMNSERFKSIVDLFSCLGKIEIVEEKDINAVTALSGSGPAYVYMFIEALADGAVMMGLSREQAYRMAAQTLIGAAKMHVETNMHPGSLKDMVCSPDGTTIEAVYTLEKGRFRAAIMEAVKVCAKKGEELSR